MQWTTERVQEAEAAASAGSSFIRNSAICTPRFAPSQSSNNSMKVRIWILLALAIAFKGYGQNASPNRPSAPSLETSYSIKERGANHRVWERIEYELAPNGEQVPRVHQYTELATGMHYKGAHGEWLESKEEIQILPGNAGAAAIQGQHKVIFPVNLSGGKIELNTPDEKWLRSRVLGLSYYDTASGKSVLIAEVKDSIGEVIGNQVVYPDAFSDFKADVRYTWEKGSFEQDIILREQPPGPEEYGLDPDTTKLQVLTEFFDPPQTKRAVRTIRQNDGTIAEDDDLDFGAMRFGRGKAFSINDKAKDVSVAKQWLKLEGRQFLIEEVGMPEVQKELKALPKPLSSTAKPKIRTASNKRSLPSVPMAKAGAETMRMAQLPPAPREGFVMDYIAINGSETNWLFKGDSTYYISGYVYPIYGDNVTIEGGCVIKFARSAGIDMFIPLICKTSPYRPAVLTAVDDNSVGETISGSTGAPSGIYAGTALAVETGGSDPVENLRILYANCGIALGAEENLVRNCQFINTTTAMIAGINTRVENVLFSNVGKALYSFGGRTIDAGFITAHHVGALNVNCSLNITNSLLICVTNWGSGLAGAYNYTNSSDAGIFQTVGGGNHYLAANSACRDAGTSNLAAEVLADIQSKTTYPPIAYTNVTFSVEQTFSPQAHRDTDIPDLGYHYDPLDYTFGGCTAETNLTFTAGTAAGWFRTTSGWTHAGQAIRMNGPITVSFAGTMESPAYWVRLNTVQEQDHTAGYGHGSIENWAGPDYPTVRGRFLCCSAMAGENFNGYFADDYGGIRSEMTHSEFWSGALFTYGDKMFFTNCLMLRVNMGLANGSASDSRVLRNCTFVGGQFNVSRTVAMPVSVRDCSFDNTSFSTSDSYANNSSVTDYDYNAFLSDAARTYPQGAHDVIIVNFDWQTGALGSRYLPTASDLINKGSRSANLSMLYHFTTQTNQVKELNSVVDIGYHYVAVDSNDNPIDTDGDGLPDYIEDADGDGLVDNLETDWMSYNANGTLGFKNGQSILIFEPKPTSQVP